MYEILRSLSCWTSILATLLFLAGAAHAGIVVSGNHSPTYNGVDDPWIVGGDADSDGFGDSSLSVGSSTVGSVEVTDGSVVSSLLGIVGDNSAGNGTVIVRGAGSEWKNKLFVRVASDGVGAVNVREGGRVTSSSMQVGFDGGSQGSVSVNGTGSTWSTGTVSVGGISAGSTGSLRVENGGTVTNTLAVVGDRSLTTGGATVTGIGSEWNTSNSLTIGKDGVGVLTVENGGVVAGALSFVGGGIQGQGTATVTGAGSQWNASTGLYVGYSGVGELTIENGGVVDAGVGGISSSGGLRQGSVTVTGTGSQWNSEVLHVGSNSGSAQGTLNISNGAVVTVDRVNVRENGVVNFSGGKLDVEVLDLAAASASDDFNFTGGRLVADSVSGHLIQNGGVFTPGDSPGLSILNGDYTLNSGSIEFELAGLTRGTLYDSLEIRGLATLDGIMGINLIGFTPEAGDSFWLIDAESFTGTPSFDFSNATLSSGLTWNATTFMTDGHIFVSSAAVPEPGSFAALCFVGIGCLSLRIRKRAKRTAE